MFYSNKRFPLSLENIPRSRGCLCLSLKYGCLLVSLLQIMYSVVMMAASISVEYRVTIQAAMVIGSFDKFEVPFILALHVVNMVLSVVLLVGVIKDNYKLIRPWVLWTTFLLIANLIFLTAVFSLSLFYQSTLNFWVVDLVALVIKFYLLTVVASFYKDLKEESNEKKKEDNDSCYELV